MTSLNVEALRLKEPSGSVFILEMSDCALTSRDMAGGVVERGLRRNTLGTRMVVASFMCFERTGTNEHERLRQRAIMRSPWNDMVT